MQTFKTPLLIPLIVSGTFLISCFVPVLQIIILTFDGGLLSYFNKIIFNDNYSKFGTTNWIVNFSLSILLLVFLLRAKTRLTQILFSILSIIFLFSLIAFIFMADDKTADPVDPEPYFLYFVIESLISGIILCAIVKIKNKLQRVI
ncbi:hypothetical protein SAMN05443549_1011087 [Flavobacterium fluvii]|uniref:Lipoprotein n=1 Tax=Flavobacterium fluvii TaxID=468056 RepID=A0A1M5G554_9FLAO|nr:hypothetical protein SAMN05443549_1011087 [Flavobacterium fluvii]